MSFEQVLIASGFRPRVVQADGKWRRCATDDKPKKRNGAYVLHPDGRGYFRNWAVDAELNKWEDGAAKTSRRIDPERIKRQKEAERTYRVRSMNEARARWSESQPMRGLHPYLEAKQLTAEGCQGLRVFGDLLIVPVFWGESLTSIQAINSAGEKRFWTGAPVKGGAFILRRQNAALTAVCEGLATGLAVYQSMRHASVVVAFDAGNLLPVIERIKPTGSVVICADNDHGTEAKRGINPGVEKAQNAAELIGAGVAWPEDIEGSDWADALVEWGDKSHKRIERLIQAKARYVMT